MPPPSNTNHLPSTHPATRQRPKSPNRVLAEAEAQWLFTEAELANTPSIQDGMSQAEEKEVRAKGVNFIVQVGIMLKLPQLTLSTASIFFQRYLMRASLKQERDGIPKLHHYQAAATALFLATKVEESCRKMKELIVAFCRVAQKNPNLLVDEQSKDWWRWKDCIMYHEDVLLETLCFDLTVESPHRQLFEMLKYYGVEHNKRLRNAAWAFVTDSNNTQLCLLCSSRAIAVTSLYAACKYCNIALPDDAKGRPWWEGQQVRLKEIRRAMEYMSANYDHTANKVNGIAASGGSEGNGSIYVGLSTPALDGANDGWDSTRAKDDTQESLSPCPPPGSQRRASNASSTGTKRSRDEREAPTNGDKAHSETAGDDRDNKRPRLEEGIESNGIVVPKPETAADAASADPIRQEEELRVENGNKQSAEDVKAQEASEERSGHEAPPKLTPPKSAKGGKSAAEEGEVSEEGEVGE
ncbi:hypothetical protein M409DRAFT_67095 [Zasmidium cellare ATCC 36951]|uniref:RNA polymerase II holoenzyme cyclin-like subunit n=1 Tax=Zasmidium cellare ATCC 36951 TaxID=1080233 RepID=A0A6A6CEU9_ZASCE|nr:uncharacterized protein M409DRAFT_67095 [Zasmidium cellare ATCC 36951]KAF2165744.1 hypothetical protein M409DRAFT_67095 [Zasmidium cellare ATCC 36951]